MFKKQSHTKKCNIYYILDLIDDSFKEKIPVRTLLKMKPKDERFMSEIKEKCELHKNCTNFVKAMISMIDKQNEYFERQQ